MHLQEAWPYRQYPNDEPYRWRRVVNIIEVFYGNCQACDPRLERTLAGAAYLRESERSKRASVAHSVTILEAGSGRVPGRHPAELAALVEHIPSRSVWLPLVGSNEAENWPKCFQAPSLQSVQTYPWCCRAPFRTENWRLYKS